MFKIVTLLLLALVVISLFDGLWVLFRDNGAPNKSRLLQRLIIRSVLALGLVLLLIYGFYTGKLQSQAPWSHKYSTVPVTQQ